MNRLMFPIMFVLGATTAHAALYEGDPIGYGISEIPAELGHREINFSWSHGSRFAWGYAVLQPMVDGGDHLISGYMVFHSTDVHDSKYEGTYSLQPGGPSTFVSPSGYFIADNWTVWDTYYDSKHSQYVTIPSVPDYYGWLFSNGTYEVNLCLLYGVLVHDTASDCVPPAVSEPSTMAIAALPVALAMLCRFRRSRRCVIA